MKPIAIKGEQPESKQKRHLIELQQSPAFKNGENKISIYDAEEKRIRDLYGSKTKTEYQMKLNDTILSKT